MKKWMMVLLFIVLFALTACGNEDVPELQSDEATDEKTEDIDHNEQPDTEEETVEVVDESEEPDQAESPDQPEEDSVVEETYTAAEQCIMTQLAECEGVAEANQFQAYQNLVADGTLAQAPGSGCLSCAVKYSFEMKYGESNPIKTVVLPRSEEHPEDITNVMQYVQQYLFALPAYFNNQNDDALNFYQSGSDGYNILIENKASGNFANHMTYSVFIDREESNPDGSTSIYTYRTYSHQNTDGVFEAYTRYNVVASNNRYYIISFEELENKRME